MKDKSLDVTRFESLEYLQSGNEKQRQAYRAINRSGIMDHLSEYRPILCGTLPIGINISGSDLDIIMDVVDFQRFEQKVRKLYGDKDFFRVKKLMIRQTPVIKANFIFSGFEFELFGQPQAVKKQYAYLHMIIEAALIRRYPDVREEIIKLKMQGYKTEPAFCKVLGLVGDPYDALIGYGKTQGII